MSKMKWLPPNYRILYCKNEDVYDYLKSSQNCLFCIFNGNRVALVTDIEKENGLKFTLYELKPDSLKNINSEEYYIDVKIESNYIDSKLKNISNDLIIKKKENFDV